MPGFFGTNNPTPWANPVGGAFQGTNLFGNNPLASPAPTTTTTPTAPAGGMAAPGGVQNAPAAPLTPPPSQPAPSDPALQGFGGDPTVPPVNDPGPTPPPVVKTWADAVKDRGFLESLKAAYIAAGNPLGTLNMMSTEQLKQWYESGGYVPGGTGVGPGGPGNVVAPPDINKQLSDLFGSMYPSANKPFSGTDTFGLPGQSKGGEAMMQFLANILAAQVGEQAPRSIKAETMYDDIYNAGMGSSAFRTASDASRLAGERIAPGALAGYESDLRSRASSEAGQGYQTNMQRLRDSGMLGRGGMGVDPALAAGNASNEQLSRRNMDITNLMEQLTSNRLGQAGELSQQGANVFQNMMMVPGYNYAQQLRGQQNSALAPLLEFLTQQGQMAITGDVAARSAPSDFERIGVPLIGSALGAAGNVIASDRRLKTGIRYTGRSIGGVPEATFRYVWGGPVRVGVIAQDAEILRPDAVVEVGGWKYVDYGALS